MYRHLFGPVPSRRLGTSLGIDLTPGKVCTFNCVYCECGKTATLTTERSEFIPDGEVINELREYLSRDPKLDSVTFSGSGEPTLHTGIGSIISFLKEEFPSYRVTVLTNSSLLHLDDVRRDISRADIVIPSLDAVSEAVFLRLNRPAQGLTSALLIEGLKTFCSEFPGQIWLEIFLVPGVNDAPSEREAFRRTLADLRVDRVQLNTLDRPGAVSWIAPVSSVRLEEIARALGPNVEIVASRRATETLSQRDAGMRELLLSTIQVRPCTTEDLEQVLGVRGDEIALLLQQLIAEDLVDTRREARGIFYYARIGKHTTGA